MTTFQKSVGLVIAGIVVGLLFSAVVSKFTSQKLGGIYHQTIEEFYAGLKAGTSNQFQVSSTGVITSGGITVGASGTALAQVLSGSCTLTTTALPMSTTSPSAFSCAVTGAASGDKAFVSLNNGHATSNGSFNVVDVSATTNSLTVYLDNNTGVATTSFPLATTSAKYLIVR